MLNGIVPYRENDHDALVDIWYRAVRHTHTFLTEKDIQFYHQMVQNGALREVEVWVELNESNEAAGFIGLDGIKIEMLFVDPSYHGKGIGSRLIEHAARIKGSHLQVDVNEQNEGACRFYERYGFIQTRRSALDSSGRPFPLLHLEYKS
ncbi:Peptidyl-lysine N-acetyltransferase YjaB [Paenibacillus plantiphilus]|uniref:Peptidyl-lysine N-acetyltransferase YjaB n=1 Tax=Paenibacillus plantiphilus TaxID=2905650 RepID=A0ABN8G9N5_9BACL|nr:acetyltransferase [Paenibacillus plantiphilus]CAH1201670.1 Peptidyl-lysine N-acetyltransferase YjaB [Paenibacillus plantiphilus]